MSLESIFGATRAQLKKCRNMVRAEWWIWWMTCFGSSSVNCLQFAIPHRVKNVFCLFLLVDLCVHPEFLLGGQSA